MIDSTPPIRAVSLSSFDVVYDLAPSFAATHLLQECIELNAAILAEPALAAIRPLLEPSGTFVRVDGDGFLMGTDLVASGLLNSAVRQIYFSGEALTAEAIGNVAIDHCDRFALALATNVLSVNVVQGLTGMKIEHAVSTPWGRIVAAPSVDASWLYLQANQSATSALLVNLEAKPITFDEFDPEMIDIAAEKLRAEERIEARLLVQLSVLLGASGDDFYAPDFSFETSVTPFSNGSSAIGASMPNRGARQLRVTESVAQEIERWAEIIDASYRANIAVSARRLISAVGAFRDESDSLIDAVMVWENLVGTNGETVFRVTAALAHLLESDASQREVFRRKLAKTYDIRSRIVHGDDVDSAQLSQHRKDAVRVAIDAMRAVLERGPGWTGVKSAERSTRLLVTG
jgi:hypothetical protein